MQFCYFIIGAYYYRPLLYRLEAITKSPREGAGEGDTKEAVDIGRSASETRQPGWKFCGGSLWKGVF